MHKESFIINRNTFLHVSTLLDHLQGDLFVIVTLRLQLDENVLLTVYWRRELSAVRGCSAGRDRGEFTPPKTTQYTVNSTFSFNCEV
jgi:hypothetical protein